VESIGILIIDDDPASQAALGQVLGAEGWLVQPATSIAQALQELATGKWSLVLVNVTTMGFGGPLYLTLRELAQPAAAGTGKAHVRVLFLVPEPAAAQATALLEQERLPYVVKPFNFHDLLERVSDLLMETEAIGAPIRHVWKEEGLTAGRKSRRRPGDPGRDASRNTGMFATRDDYQWSDEEIAEYERQEVESLKKKKKKTITLG
jgi:DNA-binding response OmpR family regulator